jgi:predicted nucleic acid-binding protein
VGKVSQELGQRVYFDANIIIYLVEGFAPFLDQLRALSTALNTGEILAITSELTLAEVLVKPLKDQLSAIQQAYKIFLTPTPALNVVAIHYAILEEAAQLRATTKLKLPDAIHLATARQQQCDSFLTNDAVFRTLNVPQVKLLSEVNLR